MQSVYHSPQNPNSRYTAKERSKVSYPTRILYQKDCLKGDILDFGSGFSKDVQFLQEKNLNAIGYDPFYQPEYPDKKFDTILCNYVLNVLLPKEQSYVLMAISELLKPGGSAYFSVRRDLKRTGYRMHVKHKKETYQCNVVLPYETIHKTEHCEIYKYQHFQSLKEKEDGCPFCELEKDRAPITESALVYSVYDKYPVSDGHALIIPKLHEPDYFQLSDKYKNACNLVLARTKEILSEKYSPDGFNVGINIGREAGQTVDHVHIHLIPRYEGDVEDPTGGVRGVIPDRKSYM